MNNQNTQRPLNGAARANGKVIPTLGTPPPASQDVVHQVTPKAAAKASSPPKAAAEAAKPMTAAKGDDGLMSQPQKSS